MPILKVENLVSGYGSVHILNGVNIRVGREEIISIIGPNGAGKSTLMRTIFGLVKVFDGKVFYDKQEITGLSPVKLVQRGLGYVPQSNNVFPTLTIAENLDMGAFTRKDDYQGSLTSIFENFPYLKDNLDKRAGELSGGQQRMLAISMAMVLKPRILLLDEPSAGLAPNLVTELMEKIKGINATGVAILMVEQNATRALKISDRKSVV